VLIRFAYFTNGHGFVGPPHSGTGSCACELEAAKNEIAIMVINRILFIIVIFSSVNG